MASPSFAVIAEGPTDFTVIRQILARLLEDPDLHVVQLQPTTDATTGLVLPGGWTEVFRFLASDRFPAAFEHAAHVIIHIDTDMCEEPGFGVSRRNEDGTERTPERMLELTRERLVAAAPAVFEQFENRIIFAIAFESTECWLLPLYYTDKKREKTVNCLGTLNQWLNEHEGFSIDRANKNNKFYITIVRGFRKRRDVTSAAVHNPSFASFVAQITSLGDESSA
jgi:hypothetical protein